MGTTTGRPRSRPGRRRRTTRPGGRRAGSDCPLRRLLVLPAAVVAVLLAVGVVPGAPVAPLSVARAATATSPPTPSAPGSLTPSVADSVPASTATPEAPASATPSPTRTARSTASASASPTQSPAPAPPAAASDAVSLSVTTRLVTADGKPVPNRPVVAWRGDGRVAATGAAAALRAQPSAASGAAGADPGQAPPADTSPGQLVVDTGGLATLSGLGLLAPEQEVPRCLTEAGDPVPGCLPGAVVARTDASGTVRFTVPPAPGAGGTAQTVTLLARLPGAAGAAGPALGVRVLAVSTQTTVPDLTFWQGAAKVTENGSAPLSVAWGPLPAELSATPSYTVSAYDGARGLQLVRRLVSSPVSLDARFLEDSRSGLAVAATGAPPGADSQSLQVVWVSATTPVTNPRGAPVSRGRPCAVTLESGAPTAAPTAATTAQSSCWLTSGTVADYPGPRLRSCAPDTSGLGASYQRCWVAAVTSVAIDLGRVQPVGVVVLRGSGAALLDVSTDGDTWRTLAKLPDVPAGQTEQAVRLPAETQARYVRLRVDPVVELARPSTVVLAATPLPTPAAPSPSPTRSPRSRSTTPASLTGSPAATVASATGTGGGIAPNAAGRPVMLGDAPAGDYHGDLATRTQVAVWGPGPGDAALATALPGTAGGSTPEAPFVLLALLLLALLGAGHAALRLHAPDDPGF
jgi:hypothetical protein